MKLDFENGKTATSFFADINPIIDSAKIEKISNATGLSIREIRQLVREKKTKRIHIAFKPTLFTLIERYAKNKQMTITEFLTELAAQEIFKNC